MIRVLFYIVFILSVALTAAGIVLVSRLRSRQKNDIFSTLLYFQVFIFAFGFYGIWGQVFLKNILASYISPEVLSRFSNIALLMGLPFLIFALLMLLRFSAGVSGRRFGNLPVILFLAGNFSLLLFLAYLIENKHSADTAHNILQYFILMSIIWSLLASFLIHLPVKGKELVHEHDRKIISFMISLITITYCIPLFFFDGQAWLALIFILMFFSGNIFLPVYFNYGTMVPGQSDKPEKDPSFEGFCGKFEISPRESQIVYEICNGLSNKEIADTLFISLQTVKDHTHRIYIKTNVKSRVQLINLVKEEVKE